MKTSLCIVGSLVLGLVVESAGQDRDRTAAAASTEYTVVERGPNRRVWERVRWEMSPLGERVPVRQTYVELETGMHYLVGGQWVEARAEIESVPGGAVARQGQCVVRFANNLAAEGSIELLAPDGRRLRSRVLGLSYFDAASGQSVLIAEVKDCQGVVAGTNQVVYEDAFTDLKASVRYTLTRNSFEQDVLLLERPPFWPEDYGLDPATTRLQVLTEFVDPPVPSLVVGPAMDGAAGGADPTIHFGAVQIRQGKAFFLDAAAGPGREVGVSKQWLKLEGRDFLVEEVPLPPLRQELKTLPAPEGAGLPSRTNSLRQALVRQRPLTQLAGAAASAPEMRVASLSAPRQALLLDYLLTLSGDTNDFTFDGATTYHVSGTVNLSGLTTFEGGAVIKYSPGASLNLLPGSAVRFNGQPYLPVVFTARDDNSVGVLVNGSSGTPSGYYANPALSFHAPSAVLSVNLAHFRIAFAQVGVSASAVSLSVNLSDGQLVDCQTGLYVPGQGSVFLRNLLLARFQTALSLANVNASAQNVTFDGLPPAPPGYLPSWLLVPAGDPGTMNLELVNCVLANLGAFSPARPAAVTASHTGFYNNGEAAFGSAPVSTLYPPFEAEGAGWYYLAPGSGFRDAGTLEVDSALLQTLRRGTTARPPVWSNLTLVSALTLAPAVPRDTDAPDLGYHYPPLDLLVTGPVTLTNASLVLTNGVVVGGGDGTWFLLRAGVPANSGGSATAPNRFADYRTVQEQPLKLGTFPNSTFFALNAHRAGGAAAPATLRFTRFTRLAAAGSGYDLYAGSEWRYSALAVRDCGFAGGQVCLNQDAVPVTLANNLFVNTIGWVCGQQALDFFNNTVHGPWWEFECYTRPGWDIGDNLFVDCGVEEFGDEPVNHHHNGYVNCSTCYYTALGSSDRVLTSLAFATGPLGDYYLPPGSALIDGGSVADASAAGFYYYTTQPSQTPEANSAVDIGFHYMALDAAGQCLDSDEDQLPDWWELRHFGSLAARGEEDYDSDGRWNLDEYLLGSDPNTISNLLHVESFWVNSSFVTGTVEVLAGVPTAYAGGANFISSDGVMLANTSITAAATTRLRN